MLTWTHADLRQDIVREEDRFGCGVLLKGGHLRGLNEALDVLRCGRDEWLLSAPRIRGRGMHGSGCVYSAAITAGLANGLQLVGAVKQGKEFVTQQIDRNRNK